VTDTLTVQTEISQQIAERLRLRLTKAEQHQLVKDVQVNPAAYEQLLKGRFYRQNLTQENLRNAVDCFNQSIAIDDRYALAYALLAETYQQMVGSSFLDPKDAKPKAEAAAKKALELDEGLAEAHYAVARNAISAWDWVGAEQELKRSIELSPSWARAHSGYAAFLSNMGRHDEAISEIKRARELDPLNIAWSGNLGYFLLFARRYDQAVEQLRKVLEVDKNNALAHVTLGYTYNSLEKYDQAIAEFEEDIKLQGETTSTLCYLGYALAKAGHRNRAEKILKRLETTKEYVSSVELAIVYIAFGHKERALSALEHAYAVHDVQMQYLATEPHFDELRSEPRFKELIRKIGLPQ
jgi:Flp pilus assembly protein TadD